MRTTTTDPMTLNEVADPDNAPFVIEGTGADAIKIFFESEQSKAEYLDFCAESQGPDAALVDNYNRIADNEIMGGIN